MSREGLLALAAAYIIAKLRPASDIDDLTSQELKLSTYRPAPNTDIIMLTNMNENTTCSRQTIIMYLHNPSGDTALSRWPP